MAQARVAASGGEDDDGGGHLSDDQGGAWVELAAHLVLGAL